MARTSQTDAANPFVSWASDLVCPVCHQALLFEQARVRCTGCGRVYPIIDGIPVLIADRAESAATPE